MLEQYLKESLLDDEINDNEFALNLIKKYMDKPQKDKISVDPKTGGLIFSGKVLYLFFEKNQDIPELKFDKLEKVEIFIYGNDRREIKFPQNFFPENMESICIDADSGDIVFDQNINVDTLKINGFRKFKVKFLKPMNIKNLDLTNNFLEDIDGPIKIDRLYLSPGFITRYFKNHTNLNVKIVNNQ